MKRLLFVLAISALPAIASAAPGNGIDMQWQDCVGGPAAVNDRVFNCTGNSTHSLNLNFKVNTNLPGFVAGTAFIDILSEVAGPLSPFWHYESGGCQRMGGASPNGVSSSDALPATTTCTDNFSDIVNGDASAGLDAIAAYGADVPTPGRGKFIVGVALGSAIPITAGDNKYLMQLNFNTRNRVGGPGGTNCTGCGEAVAMVWNTLTLESNDGTPPYDVTGADKGVICATIQSASPATCSATPVRSRTWGALKTMYR